MANKHSFLCAKALLAALLLSAIPALAQTIVSTLRGRVTDPQSAVVVGATVTARQINTNLTRISRSDSLGQYLIANIAVRDSTLRLFRYGSEVPWTVTSVTFICTRVEPRDSRRGHDYRDADVRLSKVFRFRERFAATVFWEVFNLFNYDTFYNYQGSLQSS